MEGLSPEHAKELALHGITTEQDAHAAPSWLVDGELRAALHGHSFEIVPHIASGWDVHLGPPGHEGYQGAHVVPKDGSLRWRVCTERNFLRSQIAVEEHEGSLLHLPISLNPDVCVLELRIMDGQEDEKNLLTFWQPHLFEGGNDVFGNKFERDGSRVRVTAPDGMWASFLLEGQSVVAIETPLPDREIRVTVGDSTVIVPVPASAEVTLATLLAGRVSGQVRVRWDGKTRNLSQRALWNEVVSGNTVTVL